MKSSALVLVHVSRAASAVCLAALITTACGQPNFVMTATKPFAERTAAESPLTKNVVLVSIDGLRPDAIAAFNAPTLSRLVNEGSYTLSARTIMPSKTLPSHTSMLTGEGPDDHGILWNNTLDDEPGTIEIPTVFSEARSYGYQTAAFFSKAKFSHLQRPGTLDYSQAPGGWFGKWSAAETVTDVEKHLAKSKPNLLFVHFSDPDSEGHSHGWMSTQYGRGVLRADAAVARLMKAADAAYGKDDYTIIITADHGGHGHGHGSNDPLDVTIPWIAWGRGVTRGELPANSVQTMDTAATALFLLGIESPSGWAGTAVKLAFAN